MEKLKEITESNKLIADFLCELVEKGFINDLAPESENIKSNLYYCKQLPQRQFYLGQSKFHESWDWLMPVVEKIGKVQTYGWFSIDIEPDGYYVSYDMFNWKDEERIVGAGNTLIETVYCTVIKFIEYYNTITTPSTNR